MTSTTNPATLPLHKHVTIPNPTSALVPPIFDGKIGNVNLISGTYHGATLEGVPVIVTVGEFEVSAVVDRDALTTMIGEERAYLATLLRKMHGEAVPALAAALRRRADDQRAHVERLAQVLRETSGCRSCAEGSPVPHTASSGCRSGKRAHCTCDSCW